MRKFFLASLLALALFVPTAASAAEVYVQQPGRTPHLTNTDSGTRVLGKQYVRADNAQGFALTGADVTGLVVVGLLLVATGYVLVRVRRNGGSPQTA